MKGDFTRSTFKKKNHYSSVRMQQGRVQVDADWNEQMDIQAHLRETGAKDVIGSSGVPKYGGGFEITPAGSDLKISSGRIYVEGILCELEEETTTYLNQTDYPDPPDTFTQGNYLVYLDVWQRHVTALEDEYIREKALGGPDTATRAKTLWQVKLQEAGNAAFCSDVVPGWQQGAAKSTGTLQARAEPGDSPEPCILPPTAGYRRLENQLYRVEIHKRGTAGLPGDPNNATFKWSRDNGCITAKVKSISGSLVEISHPVPGRLDEFAPGRWIEVTDDVHELRGEPGTLVKIDSVAGNILTVSPAPPAFSEEHNRKIRLWNSEGEVYVEVDTSTNDGYLKLEDGVEIKFEAGEKYETGDYWLIPARTATADVEWPEDSSGNPVPKLPHGIKHHYCKLAVVEVDNNNQFVDVIDDCRPFFPPLNEIKIGKSCCTVTVGDGKTSYGDVDSIQAAVNKVKTGGMVCLLPGLHKANVTIDGGKNITITGCGRQALVIPEDTDKAVFTIRDSQFITLLDMDIATFEGTAVLLEDKPQGMLKEIEIAANRICAFKNAVRVLGGENIKIFDNKIRMLDQQGGDVAVFMMAEESSIENNDISVVPAPDPLPPEAEESIYSDHSRLIKYMNQVWEYTLHQHPADGFSAAGGIQIASTSERIKILGNSIIGGAWNGITLGHTPLELDEKVNRSMRENYGLARTFTDNVGVETLEALKAEFDGFIENLAIENNEIRYMGLNGIGVLNFFSLKEIGLLVSLNHIIIYRNTIVKCLGKMPDRISDSLLGEIALGGVALADCENLTARENVIEENGTGLTAPVCGIYIQHGERIDISDNRILNNGPKTLTGLDSVVSGIGGGIVIRWSFLEMLAQWKEEIEGGAAVTVPYTDGVPAVKIHDNIVTQPLGKALLILAMGPVSVVGNHFTSLGVDPHVQLWPLFGGAVLIVNLGVSRDLFAVVLLAGLKSVMRTRVDHTRYVGNFNAFAASSIYFNPLCWPLPSQPPGGGTIPGLPGDTSGENPIYELLLYLPGGNVLFSNNRVTLDLRSKERQIALCSQFIFSLDDISYVGNQSECNSLLEAVIADVLTLGATVRNNDNRFQEGLTITLFSLISIAILLNTCTANQASHCLIAAGIRDEKLDNNMVLFGSLLQLIFKDMDCEHFNKLLKNFLKSAANIKPLNQ